jgi:uncharacterized protein (DUF2384 family)
MANEKEVSLDELFHLAQIGLTEAQMAASLGISTPTFERRKKEDEQFLRTLKEGKAAGITKVTNALFKGAVEHEKPASQIFFLKNRAGWTDRQEVDVSGSVGVDVQLDAAIEALKDAGIDPSSL